MGLRKQLKELLVVGMIIGFLYITGLHTELAAMTQQLVLSTGLMNAVVQTDNSENEEVFDYSQKLKTFNGETVSMEQYKGKLVFLNLWASWCGPCRAEMRGIQKLYDELKGYDNIEFVILSVDRSEAAAYKYIEKSDFEFPTYTMGASLTEQLRVPSIPTTFVIAPDGKIIFSKVGMAKYNTKSFQKFLLDNAK